MRHANDKLLDAVDVVVTQNSDEIDMTHLVLADMTATIAANNPSDETFDTGVMDIKTFTFPAKAGVTDGDHIIFYEPDSTAWAIALDTAGTTAPSSSAQWDAVAAGNKVVVDLTTATTAAEVAALVETAVDGLTGFTSVITTDDTAADGTMTFTQIVPGVVSDAVPLDDTAAGAGSITSANTTPGTATEVDIANDKVTIGGTELPTGTKVQLTTTGTLPAGLATGTDYWMVANGDGTNSFASSRANAIADTPTLVDITDYGTTGAVHTIDVVQTLAGSIKWQKNNEPESEDAVWVDIDDNEVTATTNSQSYSGAGNLNWVINDVGFRSLRSVVDNTSGTALITVRVNAKGA